MSVDDDLRPTSKTQHFKHWVKSNLPMVARMLAPMLASAHSSVASARQLPRVAGSYARSGLRLSNPKVFCIGRNKTGTTSLSAALTSLGYRVGDQRAAELMIEDWGKRDFRRLIRYCHTADAFQDVPFSLRYTFQALDAAFPGSKFILSVRDSTEQWYQSVVKFQSMRLERRTGERRVPTIADLRTDPYVYEGYLLRVIELRGQDIDRCVGEGGAMPTQKSSTCASTSNTMKWPETTFCTGRKTFW